MALYPHAIYKPITASKGRKKMYAYNRMNFHVAVSEAKSLHGYFNKSGIPDSHFYVRKGTRKQLKKGLPATIEQYVDTAYNAFADLEGSDATLSVETQGGVENAQGEKWDAAQLKALANLFAWSVQTHKISPKLATSSELNSNSQGLSWHRLGIDGNFPSSGILAGRLQRGGGMHYSKSRGKTCPGDAKIKQIPGILDAAIRLNVSGGGTSVPSKPKPAKPAKPAKPKHKKIKVDGWFGAGTIGRAQEVAGTYVDRVVSGQPVVNKRNNPGLTTGWQWQNTASASGSSLIRELQRQLKRKGFYRGKIDGWAGPLFWTGFQRALGSYVDGRISRKSISVKKFQRNLNKGKLWSK